MIVVERGASCLVIWHRPAPGTPNRGSSPRRSLKFVHASHMIVMLFEVDHWVRRIYTDGRGHPDGYPVTWMGHAVGTWDGDTLVVDTVNINDQSWWLDNLAHPKTDALHIIEPSCRSAVCSQVHSSS